MKSKLLYSLLMILMFLDCKKVNSDILQVTAIGGLKVREGAGLEFNEIAQIPEFSRVKLLEETNKEEILHGVNGKWVKVEWNGKQTYAFDGFLKPITEKFSKGTYIETQKEFFLTSAEFDESKKSFSLGDDCLGITYSEYSVNLEFKEKNIISSVTNSADMGSPECLSLNEETLLGTYTKSGNVITAKFTDLEIKTTKSGTGEGCNVAPEVKKEKIDNELFLVQVNCDSKNALYVYNKNGFGLYSAKE
ncbi:MAG: SH3 domain-containing protein [Leptospiraceae bacterium]|nr:SH3 domain-containing protein [Leptospiraceae bacterium]